jgi:hypothetical protein
VDLLKLANPIKNKYAVKGRWHFNGKTLVSPLDENARIQLPYVQPEEYELRVVVQHKQGQETMALGLPLPDFRTFVIFDAGSTNGYYSGFQLVDGLSLRLRNEYLVRGPVLTKGSPSTILCKVGREELTVTVNERVIAQYAGNFQRLRCKEEWEGPIKGVPTLGSWQGSYHFSAVELTPVSGPGRPLE